MKKRSGNEIPQPQTHRHVQPARPYDNMAGILGFLHFYTSKDYCTITLVQILAAWTAVAVSNYAIDVIDDTYISLAEAVLYGILGVMFHSDSDKIADKTNGMLRFVVCFLKFIYSLQFNGIIYR